MNKRFSDSITSKISIIEVISLETKYTIKNRSIDKCPFCGSGTGSNKTCAFHVYPKTNSYFCFACNEGGNPINFISKLHGINNANAAKYLDENYGTSTVISEIDKTDVTETKLSKLIWAIKQNDNAPAIEYLEKKRGIKLTETLKKAIFYDSFKHSVVFFDRIEQLVNYRGINSTAKGNTKGSKLTNAVFDNTLRKDAQTVFITEGVINALSLNSLGHSALAFFSTSNRVGKADRFKRYLEGKHIVLAFDPDNAGIAYTQFWIGSLVDSDIAFRSVSVLKQPPGEDINDLLRKGELTGLLEDENNREIRLDKKSATKADILSIYEPVLNKDGYLKDIKIQYANLNEVFRKLGFIRYDIDMSSIYIKNLDNVLTQVSTKAMQDEFLKLLEDLPEKLDDYVSKKDLIEKFYRNPGQYFSEARFSLLRPTAPIEFVTDTKDKSFLFFRNAYIEIAADQVIQHPYSELEGKIWKNQIIDHDIQYIPNQENKPVFEKFLRNVSGKDENRFSSLLSIIGYLAHSYYDGKLKAVILTDSSISEGAEGRTGKTLFAKAFGQIKVYVEINGKDFDPSNRHKYQSLSIDTEVVHLNDAKRTLQFELLFNDITEGLSIEKKGKTPIRTHAKMIVSTNRTISLEGGSARDRAFEFEFSDHYSEHYSPADEFGHWMFRDWDEEEYNRFYNLYIKCIQLYLKKGLIEAPSINLERRKLIEATCMDFVNFMDEQYASNNFQLNQKIEKKELHERFLVNYPEYSQGHKYQHQRNFTVALRKWAEFTPGVESKVEESSSGGSHFITFQTN